MILGMVRERQLVPCCCTMPRKRPRTDADVERLAAEFRERWTPAYGISPWLRKMGPRLHRMVRDDSWAWADIGRAMTLAGITYESGKPWNGTLLMVKAAQARKQLRDRLTRAALPEVASLQSPAAVSLLPAQEERRPPPDIDRPSWLDQSAEVAEPAFALASFSPSEFIAPRPDKGNAPQPKAAPTRPRVDADEILRRLQGGAIDPDRKD